MSDEFLVNTTTANAQFQPTVATDEGGNFVIAWESQGQDGSSSGIYFQRFAADLTRLGGETLANTFTADAQRAPQVARDADGDFVIVWQSRLQNGDGEGIFARRYTTDGVPLGGEVQVNSDAVGNQDTPAVNMNADGDFAVVWRSLWQTRTGAFSTIFLQRFNAAGLMVGVNQPVNSHSIHRDSDPSVAIDDDGDLAVAWHYLRNPDPDAEDPDEWDIVTRRFAWNGEATTDEYRVNTYTQRNQQHASIAADADGDFVIAWESYLQDGSGTGVYAQRFQSVINTPPIANAGGPYTTVEGEVLQLRGVGSFDPDRGQSIRSFSWDVNDDGVFDDAVGIAPSFTWAELNALGIVDDGSRELRLRVTDSVGATNVATANFTIRDTAPSEVLHHPLAGVDEGGTQTIIGSFEDPGLLDAHQAVVDCGGTGRRRHSTCRSARGPSRCRTFIQTTIRRGRKAINTTSQSELSATARAVRRISLRFRCKTSRR